MKTKNKILPEQEEEKTFQYPGKTHELKRFNKVVYQIS